MTCEFGLSEWSSLCPRGQTPKFSDLILCRLNNRILDTINLLRRLATGKAFWQCSGRSEILQRNSSSRVQAYHLQVTELMRIRLLHKSYLWDSTGKDRWKEAAGQPINLLLAGKVCRICKQSGEQTPGKTGKCKNRLVNRIGGSIAGDQSQFSDKRKLIAIKWLVTTSH